MKLSVLQEDLYDQAEALSYVDVVCKRLNAHYAVVGGAAVAILGGMRDSTDLDILIDDEKLDAVKKDLSGINGFRMTGPFLFYHTKRGLTQVDFLPSGHEFESGIRFPMPTDDMIVMKHGYRFLKPEALIYMKLEAYLSEMAMKKYDLGERFMKHYFDIVNLLRWNRSSVNHDALRKMIRTHVDRDLVDKYLEIFDKAVTGSRGKILKPE